MAILKAFKGLRPPDTLAKKVASRPYDVLNSEEAREEAKGNEYSLLHIIKPEIDLPEGTDIHSEPVYQKAKENFEKFQQNGWLIEDNKEYLYIYGQTMFGKTQYGIVGCNKRARNPPVDPKPRGDGPSRSWPPSGGSPYADCDTRRC